MSSLTATKQKESHSPISCKNARAKERLREETSKKAYELYEQNGHRHGHHEADWQLAESQIAKNLTDIQESASWYAFQYPLDRFRLEDISVAVDTDGATVMAEHSHLADDAKSRSSYVSRESLFLTARWPTEVDVSTASAYLKEGVLTVTAKRAHAG